MTESEDKPKDGADAAPAEADASAAGGATTSPEQRVAELEKEKADLRDRMLRIAADFENYKKRARKDLADGEQKAREQVLREMLEVVDNLDRATTAFSDASDAASVLRGVALVLRLFHSKLERFEVKVIEAKGHPFDPRLHEAISQVATGDQAPGTVVNEMQKGYRVGDRLLRAAVVAVATPPKPATPTPDPAVEVEVVGGAETGGPDGTSGGDGGGTGGLGGGGGPSSSGEP